MSPRLRRLAGSAILAVLGLVLLGAGLAREQFIANAPPPPAPSPPASWSKRQPTFRSPRSPSPLRAQRQPRRRSRRDLLVDRAGRQLRVAVDAEAAARARYDALHAFLVGDAAAVDVTTGPSWWLVVLGALALAAAPWFALRGPLGRGSAPIAHRPAKGASGPVIALVVGALVLAGMAASTFYARTRGSLQLVCHQRCEVDGGTCMPGGDLMLSLAPGEHEVRIYDPDAPAIADRPPR